MAERIICGCSLTSSSALSQDDFARSWREPVALYMEASPVMSDEQAFEMVDQLQEMAKRPERRVRTWPSCDHSTIALPRRRVFRFLDLPAEIRNQTYEHLLVERRVQRLRCFVPPAMSRVCRQLRHESLPVFFYLNTFIAEVRSTFIGYAATHHGGARSEYVERCSQLYRTTGTVSIASDINPLVVDLIADTACFRNVDICIVNPKEDKHGDPKYEYAVLSLRHQPLKTAVHVKHNTRGGHSQDQTHFQYVLGLAQRLLAGMIHAQNYYGLSFDLIQTVAAAFRADYVCYQERIRPLPAINLPLRKSTTHLQQVSITSRVALQGQMAIPDAANSMDEDEFDLEDAEEYFPK